jgi:hypothetical protein
LIGIGLFANTQRAGARIADTLAARTDGVPGMSACRVADCMCGDDMGIDISVYLEYRCSGTKNWDYFAQFLLNRDSSLWLILRGLEPDSWVPDERGLPSDCHVLIKEAYKTTCGHFGSSYLSALELTHAMHEYNRALVADGEVENSGLVPELYSICCAMRGLVVMGCEARFVFWFD